MSKKRMCSVDGCDRPFLAKDRCGTHYNQWRRSQMPECCVPDCDKSQQAKGLCQAHYSAQWIAERDVQCLIEGCERRPSFKGFCGTHGKRLKEHGDPLWTPPERDRTEVCRVETCTKLVTLWKESLCDAHYKRLLRYGDPTLGGPPKDAVLNFVIASVKAETDECIMYRPKRRLTVTWKGKRQAAARVVCELVYGPNPKKHACHEPIVCHNKACINWRHCRWDTPSNNHLDKLADGTHNRGERNNMAILCELDVRTIRSSHASGVELADQFGVSTSTISLIRLGKSWGWLPNPDGTPFVPIPRYRRRPRA